MQYKIFRDLVCFLIIYICSVSVGANEAAVSNYFQSIQGNPTKLRIFLQQMPKGGDLHMHLGGDVYAEDLLRYASKPEDHYCLDRKTFTVTKNVSCAAENQLATISKNPQLYNAVINAWSMRDFIAGSNESGHDHFFNTFAKFLPIDAQYEYKDLADTIRRAASQNESYLEVMVTPNETQAASIIEHISWVDDFPKLYQQFVAAGLLNSVAALSKQIDQLDEAAHRELSCNKHEADISCSVKVRYLYQTFREQTPKALFAQLMLAFATVQHNHKLVGINIVQPEDGFLATRDYSLHMRMIGFLHRLYPSVNISLHAGELYLGLVPPADLRFHINEAVRVGCAQRIGHGVSIAFEKNAEQLLHEMAKKQVLVEINLTSNDKILGVRDNVHPLPLYLRYHVPIAISTDDEGVLRTDLTNEYVRAVLSYHFTYSTLKNIVRNSITYSFLKGKRLWRDSDNFIPVTACRHDNICAVNLSKTCAKFLVANEKARMQWDLECRFLSFENRGSF